MAILRNAPDADDPISYVASAAFLCCVSMVVLGLFGFYAKVKVASKRSKDEDVPVVCISGAYRPKRDDFFETGYVSTPPKKITPAMVTLPLNNGAMKPSKSTNDMREPEFRTVILNKSTPDISLDPRGASNHNNRISAEVELRHPKKSDEKNNNQKLSKKQQNEQKARENADRKLIKKRQDEQKAREKAAQDLAKKEAKEKLKQEKEQAKLAKAKNKKTKDKAPPLPLSPPPQTSTAPPDYINNLPPRQPTQTDTLRSDINRSSGPPPYSESPHNIPPQASTSNVSFGRPIDNTPSSWDLVNQHRQQMSRPTATIGGAKKQMIMDLQYNMKHNANDKDNSEA
ncbi:ubiquitin carboxyl-terminal hydrolase 8-like [Plodia interpunctella]|uniref:ubiquitin carboxyl-terminal hydrolase 8-like n=1 Tax=Plodia interpunctella TaxID=58824 RepID=UPI002368968F|nr:ubiquitin carboxyl-terminal hydrolase 8-like [Plodia interpunctella]